MASNASRTLTVKFQGVADDLVRKSREAKEALKGTGDAADDAGRKTSDMPKKAERGFRGMASRFKELVGIGKKSGDESGGGFIKGLMQKTGDGMKRVGSSIKTGLGNVLKGGLMGIGAKLGIDFMGEFKDSIMAGSNLEQSVGGLQAVFKEQFAGMDQAARAAAAGVGLSRNQYNELATTLGAGLKNKGLDDFAGQTQKLIGLGADLSAVYGGSAEEAVSAISSLMRGEADPIERYGVAINETAVSAELAARGQDKLTGAALEQAKAQARVDILMRQTADAQGGFARETDTVAHKVQVATAQYEDMKAKLGEALLPTLSSVMGFISDTALPGLERFGEGAGKALGGLKDLLVSGDFTAELGEAFGISEDHPVVGWLLDTRQKVLDVWGEITGGVAAFSAAWEAFDGDITSAGFPGWMEDMAFRLRRGWESITGALGSAWAVMEPIFEQVRDWLVVKWAEIQPAVSGIFSAIGEAVSSAMEFVEAVVERGTEFVSWVWSNWGTNILTTLGILVDTVVGLFRGLWEIVGGIWKTLTGVLTGDWSKAKEGIIQIGRGLWTGIVAIFTGLKDSVINAGKALWTGLGLVWQWIKDGAVAGWNALKGAVMGVVTPLVGSITGAFGEARDGIGRALDGIKAAAAKPVNFVINTVWNNGLRKALNLIPGVDLKEAAPIKGYDRGGWTGPGQRYQPAGIVHADEYVVTKPEVRAMGGPGRIRDALSLALGMLPGYAGGGAVRPVPQGHNGWRGGRYSSGKWHGGLDFPAAIGTPVRAMWGGTVTKLARLNRSYGHHVMVSHGGGIATLYAHMSQILTRMGAALSAGQVLGRVGSTGNSTGPHLHLEVRRGGTQVDPTPYLAGARRPSGGSGVPDASAGDDDTSLLELPSKILGLIKQVRDGLTGPWGDLIRPSVLGAIDTAKDKVLGGWRNIVGGYRAGGVAGAGPYMVGEGGPEIISMRGGENVITMADVRRSATRGTGTSERTPAWVEEMIRRLVAALEARDDIPLELVIADAEIRRIVQAELRRTRGAVA